jgi:hypothetical protein
MVLSADDVNELERIVSAAIWDFLDNVNLRRV